MNCVKHVSEIIAQAFDFIISEDTKLMNITVAIRFFALYDIAGDALVLIDEADVFLEARNSTEIARNALGKIFWKACDKRCVISLL